MQITMAMLARRSRTIPRIFCNFANSKHLFRKPKFQTVETQNIYSSNRLAALSSFCVKCDSQLPLKYGHTHTRGLHTSLLSCNEFKTVVCPDLAESLTEGDIKWEKAVGDVVKVDETIGEVETAKTSIKIPSPVAGVIDSLLVKDGETISPGANICIIRVGDEAKSLAPQPSAAATKKEAKPKTPQPVDQSAARAGPIPTGPPSAPLVPNAPISSTPKSQVQPKVATTPKPSASGAAVPIPSAGATFAGETRSESRVKMNRMRLRIAERLKDAQNTCAMLTTFNEVDMSNIMDLRTKYKDAFQKKHGLKLGFMSAFIKASAYALHDQPIVNAVIDDTDILYRDYVDISVAVATPKGLVVPVIRNVEKMNYADIEKAINTLGEKARTGDLAIEDMDGGTFTISNGGVFGSMFGTPIINPPQSAILGMHGIFDRPVAVNGKVEIRPMMYVALTYDHRLIDGRDAVTFLKKIKLAVEDPRGMLLEL